MSTYKLDTEVKIDGIQLQCIFKRKLATIISSSVCARQTQLLSISRSARLTKAKCNVSILLLHNL